MSEANKELAKRFFEEVWNKSRRSAIAELIAPNAVIYESGEAIRGPEGFYPFFDRMQANFSNIHVSFHDALAEGDKVCLRWSCTMRHTGGGFGIPPTNKNLHNRHHGGSYCKRAVHRRLAELGHARFDAADPGRGVGSDLHCGEERRCSLKGLLRFVVFFRNAVSRMAWRRGGRRNPGSNVALCVERHQGQFVCF